MEFTPDITYSWESLDTTTLILPTELLTYYLYKYEIDMKMKKGNIQNEDANLISYYRNILNIEKEVSLDVQRFH